MSKVSEPPRTEPRWQGSPNHGPRRDGLRPELVVIHYTAMTSCEAALERLCSPDHEVSAHYLVARDGAVIQMVEEADRAWHAGTGEWRGAGDVNSRSIGIELDNSGLSPFPEPQMAALSLLVSDIRARWSVAPEGVIAHSDFAPDRKHDPGPRFDWRRLAREGQAVWPSSDATPVPPDDVAFRKALTRFGYPEGHDTETLLGAFRLRFRPWARGALAAGDMAAARDLADRFAR